MVIADLNILVESLAQSASSSEEARIKTLEALEALRLRLEKPHDYYMRTAFTQLQVMAARVAGDLNIYGRLVEHGKPLTVADIAAQTGAAPLFTRRLLRYVASLGHIQETGRDTFAANRMTETLAQPGSCGATWNMHTNVGPALLALPDYLKKIGYRDIGETVKRTAAQEAWQTDLPILEFLSHKPENWKCFSQHMTAVQEGYARWFDAFPLAAALGAFAGPDVFVDVGGGLGHQSLRLLAAFPDLRDRILLQDLPQTLAHIEAPLDGVRTMEHDFFTPQPVRGARFYYVRNILHDWPDAQAVEILSRLRDALGPDSSILIDEAVIPDVGAHWHATALDMTMMGMFGSRERSEDEWRVLLKKAGLKIKRIDIYLQQSCDGVIEAVPI
ncbi:Demethylsterigmatocystin 6-O-methyltransferase [Escovopsis weberi]|uniref:Demethylsterigmatocystin 6-O-methyltransferase n=1 Tax=Escovopsis weberi TaxID=150374 RepID=A0A0M9VV94_ESCWE|nr:Demethylsterigmatocystin 6-O-methyltransferase [Escovopsis weberi]